MWDMNWKQTKLQTSYETAAVVEADKNEVVSIVGGRDEEDMLTLGGIFDF